MTYKIIYANGKCCNFANSRKDLLEWLKLLKDETISDIRKLYKNGVSESVLEKYKQYIRNQCCSTRMCLDVTQDNLIKKSGYV